MDEIDTTRKFLICDAEITGGVIIIGEILSSPVYIGCRFRYCEIRTEEPSMMKAFANCIFDETCKINE